MSKRTVFTTITPLPAGIGRDTVLDTLHNHVEMIDLNPLVIDRHPCKPPPNATAEEFHCTWYQLTDKVEYLPGGLVTGQVSYYACFHDLPIGLQTHVYAPLGLNIKGRWSVGGSLPGEPKEPVEIGIDVPKDGLWLREDVDMKCNIMMTSFVKKTLKKSHSTLVDKLMEKAHMQAREKPDIGDEQVQHSQSGSGSHHDLKPSGIGQTYPYNSIPVPPAPRQQPMINSDMSSSNPSPAYNTQYRPYVAGRVSQPQAPTQPPYHQQYYRPYPGPQSQVAHSELPAVPAASSRNSSSGPNARVAPVEMEG